MSILVSMAKEHNGNKKNSKQQRKYAKIMCKCT